MSLTDTQLEIEAIIRSLCSDRNPVVTVNEIAERTPFTKRTVLNNIDTVVEEVADIANKPVGQSTVYFVTWDLMDEIFGEDTVDVIRLFSSPNIEYAEVRETSDDSEFDYEIHWYDKYGNEIEDYVPTAAEIGKVAELRAYEPVKTKYYEESSLPDLEKVGKTEALEMLREPNGQETSDEQSADKNSTCNSHE